MPFDGFSKAERSYLAGQRLGRLATVSPTGIVGNAPVAFFVRSDDTVDIGGQRIGATKKFRNVTAGSRVAFVVDDLAPGPGWHPRYLEIRGTAEALSDVQPPTRGFSRDVIKIHRTGSGRSGCRTRSSPITPLRALPCGAGPGRGAVDARTVQHHAVSIK